jgi:hypothetical protein
VNHVETSATGACNVAPESQALHKPQLIYAHRRFCLFGAMSTFTSEVATFLLEISEHFTWRNLLGGNDKL